MNNQASLASLSENNLLGKYWRLYFAVLDAFTRWFNPPTIPVAVRAGTPPRCYTAGICCYLTWKDHYRSFICCAFNKAVAVVTITHGSHVIPQWCNQRFSIPGPSVQREVWGTPMYARALGLLLLLSSVRKIHSRGIEKYKASSDLVVQNVKSDVICRKWTLDSISAHLA